MGTTYGHCQSCYELSADLCSGCRRCPECGCLCSVPRDGFGRREEVNAEELTLERIIPEQR